METIKKTSEYTIYQKRSKRYAVRDAEKRWINGDKKVEILVKEKLLKVPIPKPKPEKNDAVETSTEAEGEKAEGESAEEA